ncbi:complex I subunit 4 family protein [Hydrogenimonas urashimensis]|uniref:complex I subunit 4 family protein n=1 Tax=Hydrogenimonas urashimensis TaxID=2740515 RepID=UPI001914FAD0|nr:NADH-quinone oxidoreductase subunit M [Hydrogenimonas urashimensis]
MMEMLLSLIVFLPMLFAMVMGLLRVSHAVLRIGAMLSALAVLALVFYATLHFDPHASGMQFVRHLPWIKNYGISYYLGLDAISLVILLMIAVLMPLLHLYMWHYEKRGYWYNMLLLQTGVTGAVLSLDLILFYLFWETMLLPIFIMIGRYGHGMNQFHAMKILLMTVLGSMAMLFSILYLGYEYYDLHGSWSFAYDRLATLHFDPKTSIWLAAGFLLAFAIKIPLIGFHTWMAPAYSSAPTPALVILSAVMAKLGAYGLWRFGYGVFGPTLSYYEPIIAVLAIIGLLYFAIHAIMENNLRRMFAYSSGSHLSLIALGIVLTNIYAWSGSLYFIATHALASGGIFLMIGLLYQRTGSVHISNLGGIASVAPRFAFLFAFFALCIAGLPGTGGFVGELLIIVGAFQQNLGIGLATATTMLAAMTFVFWMLQRTLFGPARTHTEHFADLNNKEMLMLAPIALLLVVTGIAPSLFAPLFEPQLQEMLHRLALSVGGAS